MNLGRSEIKIEHMHNIYRKFKAYVYRNSNELILRNEIAAYEISDEFEESLENLRIQLNRISNLGLNKYKESEEYIKISNIIKKIDYNVIPKSFEKYKDDEDNICVTNTYDNEESVIEKFNFVIDAPIEIHLIGFYWVLKYGNYIQENYINCNYGNILYRDNANIKDTSTKTFKPYFREYSKWRNKGLKKVQDSYKNRESTAILMLDISSFFYNVDFDFDKLNNFLESKLKDFEYNEYLVLTEIIKEIFKVHNKRINKYVKNVEVSEYALPLGFVVSSILSNFYLSEFDKKLKRSVKPLYYGRYVDDMMIVLQEDAFEEFKNNKDMAENIIKKNLIEDSKILIKSNEENYYNVFDDNFNLKMKVSKEKMKLFIIDKNSTSAFIDNIVDEIRKNSSEFRYLPEESKIIDEFNKEAYSTLYTDKSDSVKKILKFKSDKYGLSKYLAKVIFTSKYWNNDNKELDILEQQIVTLFSSNRSTEYYSLWEKAFTFLVINKRFKRLNILYEKIIKNIDLININTEDVEQNNNLENVKSYLRKYCRFSLIQACSLNFDALEHINKNKNIEVECKKLRESHLIKDEYLLMPLLGYIPGVNEISNLTMLNIRCTKEKISSKKCENCDVCELKIDFSMENNSFKFAPRFIYIHEIQHYQYFMEIYKYNIKDFKTLEKIVHKNYCIANNFNSVGKPNVKVEVDKKTNFKIKTYNIPSNKSIEKLRVGVASIKVDTHNIEKSYLKEPNLSRDRFNSLVRLINTMQKTNSDIIVLPEVSIPFAWLGLLIQFSQRQQKCIIFGIEHVINRNSIALNLLSTIVPYEKNEQRYSFLRLRLKNHYSPEEARYLKAYRYDVPKIENMTYDLFKWNNCRFASFNCYELANITHRAQFTSKVDFLTASEYNKDTNYFSNIVDTISRDVHCYFIQSNSSDYGDSRITKPSRSDEKDIIKLKGGINDQIVVGEIDIKKLREFQIKEYELQKEDKSFKATPPNFDKNEVLKALNYK